MRISLTRIAEEVRKTMRRVNALEKIALPDYDESIKYIEDTLEENERE
ncbi:V-type ATP synthase subunit D, partial [bacterium]